MVTANFGVSSWPLISTTRQTNSKRMSPPTITAYTYVASRFLCVLLSLLLCRVFISLETYLAYFCIISKKYQSLLLFSLHLFVTLHLFVRSTALHTFLYFGLPFRIYCDIFSSRCLFCITNSSCRLRVRKILV